MDKKKFRTGGIPGIMGGGVSLGGNTVKSDCDISQALESD